MYMRIYRGRTQTDYYLASALYDAVEDQDYASVQSLLHDKHADPNLVLSQSGLCAFHLAVGNSAANISSDEHGCSSSSLAESVSNSDDDTSFAVRSVRAILQCGGDPNVVSDDGLTPLHIAAAWGRLHIVHLLLAAGADPDITDNCYRSARYYAEAEQHAKVVTALDEHRSVLIASAFNLDDDDSCGNDADGTDGNHSPYHRWLKSADRQVTPKCKRRIHRQCDLLLEKVVVKNGIAIGEYAIEQVVAPTIKTNELALLPDTNIPDYVRSWCQSHTPDPPICIDVDATDAKVRQVSVPVSQATSLDSCQPASPPDVDLDHVFRKPHDPVPRRIEFKTAPRLHVCKGSDVSRESGIMTLPEDDEDDEDLFAENAGLCVRRLDSTQSVHSAPVPKDTSSDYFTCNSVSLDSVRHPHEQNIFNVSGSTATECSYRNQSIATANCAFLSLVAPSHGDDDDVGDVIDNQRIGSAGSSGDPSVISVQEVYRYTDPEQNVVLFEKRFLQPTKLQQQNLDATSSSVSALSHLTSLPKSFDYDTDTLRRELTERGFEPGPVTATTKRLYLRKLYRLKRRPASFVVTPVNRKPYSVEIERTLRDTGWSSQLARHRSLEEAVSKQFSSIDPNRRWREGNAKCSFNYLLLDPRITQNLPARYDLQKDNDISDIWPVFLSSIFYIGKGKRSRPYQHLYNALELWKQAESEGNIIVAKKKTGDNCSKLKRILDIWQDRNGVVCLHVFQNVIPVEAYCREAAMISAMKLDNLTNAKIGNYYGVSSTWCSRDQRLYGVFLLYKAMMILLNEGERQISPTDID